MTSLFPKFEFEPKDPAIPATPAIPEQLNGENSRNSNNNAVGSPDGAREQALAAACRRHALDPGTLKADLVEAGDWQDLNISQLRAYVDAVARSNNPGSLTELRALIEQWADLAAICDEQRQELVSLAHNIAPALIAANIDYFRRRIEQNKQRAIDNWE